MKKKKVILLQIVMSVLILSLFGCYDFSLPSSWPDPPPPPNQPDPPVLWLPVNADTNVSPVSRFMWTYYPSSHLQISGNSGFSDIVLDTLVNSNECVVPAGVLLSNTYYFWRARVFAGGYVASNWSVTFWFRTSN